MTWDAIAVRHGTDKASTVNGNPSHGYMPRYERELACIEVGALLEVGVANGASLRMWAEVFPDARIVGVDVVDACRAHEEERIEVIIADAADRSIAHRVGRQRGPFDVIVDDGSHHPPDVVAAFESLFPYLRPGGVYFVEDLSWPLAGWVVSGLIGHDIHRVVLASGGDRRPTGGPCLLAVHKEGAAL